LCSQVFGFIAQTFGNDGRNLIAGALEWIFELLRERGSVISNQVMAYIERYFVKYRIRDKMSEVFYNLKEKYENFMTEEIDVQKLITFLLEYLDNLKTPDPTIDKVNLNLVTSDLERIKSEVQQILKQLSNYSEKDSLSDQLRHFTAKLYEIYEALAENDIQRANTEIQHFAIEIRSVYNSLMRNEIEIGRGDLSEIENVLKEVQEFIEENSDVLLVGAQRFVQEIENFKANSVMQEIEKTAQYFLSIFENEEFGNSENSQFNMEKLLSEVFEYFEAVDYEQELENQIEMLKENMREVENENVKNEVHSNVTKTEGWKSNKSFNTSDVQINESNEIELPFPVQEITTTSEMPSPSINPTPPTQQITTANIPPPPQVTSEDPSNSPSSSPAPDEDLSVYESFIKNFNENSGTHADLESLQRKVSKLIIMREKISSENMQMEIDKLVEQAKHLLERTRANYLKNYTRLQQLMNIVKEKMSEELVYRGDMEALDKHIVEINALLPRMEEKSQVAARSLLDSYEDFQRLMEERNAAMIKLQNIGVELKEGNFTGDNERVKAEIARIAEIFRNTEYSKTIEAIGNRANLIIKANEILSIAEDILNVPEEDFLSNLEQINTLKEQILIIIKTTKNIITRERARVVFKMLVTRLEAHENVIMAKLENISTTLSHPETIDLQQLIAFTENLQSLRKVNVSKEILAKIDELLRQAKWIEENFEAIKKGLRELESSLEEPTNDDDIEDLKSYLGVLIDLSRFHDLSIIAMVSLLYHLDSS
jgi:hypothetical protein